jgi:hypothetical protein
LTLAQLIAVCISADIAITAPAQAEPESADYGACRIGIGGLSVAYRIAKTTPTKIGQFVTLWKRPAPGCDIAPFDAADGIDLVIISVSGGDDKTRSGMFIFDQAVLLTRDVMSRDGVGGKRAIRVYPPWCELVASQAIRTQRWQLERFISTDAPTGFDVASLRQLSGLLPPARMVTGDPRQH